MDEHYDIFKPMSWCGISGVYSYQRKLNTKQINFTTKTSFDMQQP